MEKEFEIQLRRLAISLLDDEHGICSEGYLELQSLCAQYGQEATADIFAMARCTAGRHYLPENHELQAI